MTDVMIMEAVATYRDYLENGMGIDKKEYPPHMALIAFNSPGTLALEHCHSELDTVEKLVREGRIEKATRLICFVQGVLWREHCFSIDELRSHFFTADPS